MSERWLPVVGHSNYEVSDCGRVRRIAPAMGATPGTCLKAQVGTHGREYVSLSHRSRVTKRFVHHLVLEAFIGPRPEGTECCHWDGNPLNNHLSNLRWGTPKENASDMQRHGTHFYMVMVGEEHPAAKLTEDNVRDIRKRCVRGRGGNMYDLADEFGVSYHAIKDVVSYRSWSHLE